MKIDEAIEILRPLDQDSEIILDPDTYDAIQLSIEALHRFADFRLIGQNFNTHFLPSETKD